MKVLFLSASTGGGHAKAAEAVMEVLKIRHTGFNGQVVDTLKHISPIIDRLVVGTYLKTVKNTPRIYGKFYKLSETGENISDITKTFNKLMAVKLVAFINEYAPSVIVCTHTFPLQMLSSLKQKGLISIPVIGVVTDFVNHLFWKLDGVDAFIVAHEYIKNDMIKAGMQGERIHTLGIPISRTFLEKKDRFQLTQEFGLKNKPTILIMGGSLGFGEFRDVFKSLLKCRRDIQVIAVAGQNIKLEKELKVIACGSSKDIKILGYTNRISDLMDVSDFIITKPGGVTISEALVKKLPILIMSPIPGQEERNARFLTNTGVAAHIFRNEDLESLFCQVLDNPLRLRHMREMAEYLAKPNASEAIADLIESISDQRNILLAKTGFPSLPLSFKPSSLT
ncbi:MAG: UDP-N-acetylglucosamine--LPS N-acetylglucosamine transferase [Ruminiclostridium sp.]|nr:UDP-N-acetylglucosamine--LPS N-acetylglucosamine transferase [Ruminiclostridium sp.]